MPEKWDLYIPNREGKISHFRLEILIGSIHPTMLSMYYMRTEQRTVDTGFRKQVMSYAFCFEYTSGNLVYVSFHNGNFSDCQFRWAESREEQYEHDIPHLWSLQAIGSAKKVCNHLHTEKERVVTAKEKDKCDRFAAPLETFLENKKGM